MDIYPLSYFGALWTSPGAKDDLPPSLIIGAACLFMICITGLILMQPMPNLSTFLIYGPIGMVLPSAVFSTWPFIFAGTEQNCFALLHPPCSLGL